MINTMSWPKVPLGVRIFLLYVLFVIFCGYIVIHTVTSEIKPGVRQTMEETLVDMSNLLAVMVREDVRAGTLATSSYPVLLRTFTIDKPNVKIWGLDKLQSTHRVYITDSDGIVILDTSGEALGQDYSRWNDVYLTLRGKYGARSTKLNPDDDLSTIMHVAAPIKDGQTIIGVVTVAKANSSMQPFIERSQQRLILWSLLLAVLAVFIGALLAWRITRAVNRLSDYAQGVILGEKISAPTFRVFYEFGDLAQVLAKMREQLEGKNYAERYVQTLTHELKSPLAAIRGASEILQSDLKEADRQKFVHNIELESIRVQQLVDRMLNLSVVEQQQTLENKQVIDIDALCNRVVESLLARLTQQEIDLTLNIAPNSEVIGDVFLLEQALFNLLENALDFTPHAGVIALANYWSDDCMALSVTNVGQPIPDYALTRVCERFYSLPRPSSGRKSTGLGLNFVQEVAQLHHAKLIIANVEHGVCASLHFRATHKPQTKHT